jgi:hypothetical protein
MHYSNEGSVNVNMVGCDICVLSRAYCMHDPVEGNACVNWVGCDIVNVFIGYCIIQLHDMKYNLCMRILHS